MPSILLLLSLLSVFSLCQISPAQSYENPDSYFDDNRDRCTSIGVGPGATVDGSTITTHNNDCQECDIRITHVPSRIWPHVSKRPVYGIRVAYPRYVEASNAENIHGPDYLQENIDTSIYNWPLTIPIGYIDQVESTYAYTLGTYGIQNEKQVSIGESTCSSVFVSKPISAPGGKALLHMETLTEIALERCDTARCAIKTMGDLGVQYGFYGGDSDGSLQMSQDEAGEALTVSDATEVWMFHILPDDTGASAIWVAQRVPDEHVTVVANMFVIGEIDLKDKDNFIGSDNIFQVAERNNLWSHSEEQPFHFARVYGTNRHANSHACTRRVWRVLTLVAPSLLPLFSPYTDGTASFGFGLNYSSPYPFSVRPDALLTAQDVMAINSDQYEGTPFDLSKHIDAGPFGDTMRFPALLKTADPVNGITKEGFYAGISGPRPISLWRTAYSTVTQSRRSLPAAIGAVTWIAQYAPHFSSFVPVYASAPSAPSSLNTGTPYKLDKDSNWWIHCLTGNYLSRWYAYTIGDVREFQVLQQATLLAAKQSSELRAVRVLSDSTGTGTSTVTAAIAVLQEFQEEASANVREAWWAFFFESVGKYRDMYRIADPHSPEFITAYKYLAVPRWWLESTGFWGVPGSHSPDEISSVPVRPLNIPTEDSIVQYASKYGSYPLGPDAFAYSSPGLSPSTTSTVRKYEQQELASRILFTVLGAIVGGCITYVIVTRRALKHQYLPIN